MAAREVEIRREGRQAEMVESRLGRLKEAESPGPR